MKTSLINKKKVKIVVLVGPVDTVDYIVVHQVVLRHLAPKISGPSYQDADKIYINQIIENMAGVDRMRKPRPFGHRLQVIHSHTEREPTLENSDTECKQNHKISLNTRFDH